MGRTDDPATEAKLRKFYMCLEFGWTPDEYDRQDAIVLDEFEVMLAAEYQRRKAEEKRTTMRMR